MYDSILNWLAWHKPDRPIIPIDLRQNDWIVSYNVLRRRAHADPQVLIDSITQAVAHVWDQSDTTKTPLFRRWIGNVLRPLYEKNLTLVEAENLIDAVGGHLRFMLTHDVTLKSTKADWEMANTLSPKEFEAQIGSTVNRLLPFIQNEIMRATFGIRDVSLDLGEAIEKGHIILVNLATQGAKISEENARLFSTLLLSDLWTAAKERGKPGAGKKVKPFYVHIDEFQDVVTPTIARNLDQARGFGLHFTLANQFPRQIISSGSSGQQVYESVMENASTKVVFRLSDETNLMPLAKWLFMGVLNADEIKLQLSSTKVMGFHEETREIRSESSSSGISRGSQRGSATGAGLGGTLNFIGEGVSGDPRGTSQSESDISSDSQSDSEGFSEASSESVTHMPILVPIFGKELSSVQFRPMEEQIFRAMAALFDQQERHATVRVVGAKAPVAIRIPTISAMPGSDERSKRYLAGHYQKLKFALPGAEAQARLKAMADGLHAELVAKSKSGDEPTGAKRKIKGL